MDWKDTPITRLTLRLPEDLKRRLLKKINEYNLIKPSFNEYIIKILYRSLDQNIPFK